MNKEVSNNVLYQMQYRKENKKKVSLDINLDENEQLEKIVKELNITKVQVFRKGIEEYTKLLIK